MNTHRVVVGGGHHPYTHPEETFNVSCNGDFSGNVLLTLSGNRACQVGEDEFEVLIPFELMQELVGRWVSGKIISELEQLSGVDAIKKVIEI